MNFWFTLIAILIIYIVVCSIIINKNNQELKLTWLEYLIISPYVTVMTIFIYLLLNLDEWFSKKK